MASALRRANRAEVKWIGGIPSFIFVFSKDYRMESERLLKEESGISPLMIIALVKFHSVSVSEV